MEPEGVRHKNRILGPHRLNGKNLEQVCCEKKETSHGK